MILLWRGSGRRQYINCLSFLPSSRSFFIFGRKDQASNEEERKGKERKGEKGRELTQIPNQIDRRGMHNERPGDGHDPRRGGGAAAVDGFLGQSLQRSAEDPVDGLVAAADVGDGDGEDGAEVVLDGGCGVFSFDGDGFTSCRTGVGVAVQGPPGGGGRDGVGVGVRVGGGIGVGAGVVVRTAGGGGTGGGG